MDVEQHQVRAQLAKALQGLLAVLRHADAQAIAFQIGAEHAGNGGFVFDYKHQGRGSRLSKSSHGFVCSKVMHLRDSLNLVVCTLCALPLQSTNGGGSP